MMLTSRNSSWTLESLSRLLIALMATIPWWYRPNGPQASASLFGLIVGEQVSPAEVLH